MSDEYKSYTFTVGSSPERTYKGGRINPREGIELGLDLADLIAGVFKDIDKLPTPIDPENIVDISDIGSVKELTGHYKAEDMISFVTKCYVKMDKKKYFKLFDYILANTIIYVRKDTDKNSTILKANSKEFNDWFSEFPRDLAYFTAAVLVENAAPFLPERYDKIKISANTLRPLFLSS